MNDTIKYFITLQGKLFMCNLIWWVNLLDVLYQKRTEQSIMFIYFNIKHT